MTPITTAAIEGAAGPERELDVESTTHAGAPKLAADATVADPESRPSLTLESSDSLQQLQRQSKGFEEKGESFAVALDASAKDAGTLKVDDDQTGKVHQVEPAHFHLLRRGCNDGNNANIAWYSTSCQINAEGYA